ncbi:LLM class flavin-dependent oxidoreductase [Microbacterium sp. NPDC096154]|uniref:LLM class flavin-dependent oxidoreductase n=1 Tax=Microbacterium sp. NPDC096154 TaxID=3155549 RepID=UPI0033308E22
MKFWTSYPFFFPDINRPYGELLAELKDIAQAADELGFEGISFPEHHFFNYIANPSALQCATFVAQNTKRLRVHTGVLVLPYYHPLALAEEVAMVDHITGGRLEVGVARGANKYEFDRLGIDFSKAREMYEESLDIMKRAWTETDIVGEGEFWQFPEVTIIPKTLQQPHPKIWVSSQSERGMRAAAKAGHNVVTSPNLGTFAPHGDLEKMLGWYNESSAESPTGRGEVMVLRRVFLNEDEGRALEHVQDFYKHWSYYMSQYAAQPDNEAHRLGDRADNEAIEVKAGSITPVRYDIPLDDIYNDYDDPIITTPDRAIERFKYYESLGVDAVMTMSATGGKVDDVIGTMEVMAKHVFPEFGITPGGEDAGVSGEEAAA